MAWYSGQFADTAYGRLADELDEILPDVATWSIYDDFSGFSPTTLITNGNFSTLDFTGWSAGTGWAAGTGAAVKTAGTASNLTQTLSSGAINYTYKVTFDWTRTAGTLTVTLTNTTGSNAISSGTSGSATYYYTTAVSATSVLTFAAGSTFAGSVDNVVVERYVANTRVYECDDSGGSGALFYVLVADDNTGFALIELWEGWNSTTHAGTGASRIVFSSTYTLRIYRPASGWNISVKDYSFRMINGTGEGYYIGRPGVVHESGQNVVMFCGCSTTSGYNAISYSYPNNQYGGWCFLFDEDETQNLAVDGMSCASGQAIRRATQYADGRIYTLPTTIVNVSTLYQVGYFTDVLNFGDASSQYLRCWQRMILDGEVWMIFGTSGGYSAFKMD